MSIKNIRQQMKDIGVEASVKYLKENEKGRHDCTCMYELTFQKIKGKEYWDVSKEVVDKYHAACMIQDYLKDLNAP